MQIINCEQGTDEWFKARLGVPTASNFSKVVTSKGELSKTLSTYALELASQILIVEREESYKSLDMQRGNDLEPEARDYYQQETLTFVKELGFMKGKLGGYSPDGIIGDAGLVEIKCPNKITHTKYLYNNKLPTEYKAQVQGGLYISGRAWCDFISYHPNFKYDNRMFTIRVERDQKYIDSLEQGLIKLNEKRDEILNQIKAVK